METETTIKIPPLLMDGVTFRKDDILSITQPLLDVRDCLIQGGQLPHAAALSQINALLQHLAKHTE